ncbi:MAG TPA: cyclic nucleotide-binding domain-containing protein [Alphaproteobacteria bacterium]
MAIDPQQLMPKQTFAAGDVIFREGMIGDVAYVVQEGEVEIVRTQAKSQARKVLGIIRKGGMFGEMALVDGKPRMADAVAMKETTCMVVKRDVFERKFESADPFIKGLIRIFVRNIRSLADE